MAAATTEQTFIMNTRSPNSVSRHRSLYKGATPPWKETYRKRCMERLKTGRHKFLDRIRNVNSCSNVITTDGTDSVTANVKDVMRDEWSKLAYEHRELPAWLPSKDTCSPFPGMQVDASEESELDHFINIMKEIQQELLEEEKAMIAQYEDRIRFEEASLCYEVERLTTDDVTCPVCRRNQLMQNKQVIFCSCGIRIDTQHDGLSLSFVNTQINEAVEMHSVEGCHSQPEFLVESLTELPVNNMFMQCKDCEFLYIIV